MTFSLGNLMGEILVKKLGKENDVRLLKYARAVFLF